MVKRDKANIIFLIECLTIVVIFLLNYVAIKLQISLSKIIGPCYLYEHYGLYCMGCGGTRAVGALLHGKILTSVRYHPFVGYLVLLYVLSMVRYILNRLTNNKISLLKIKPIYGYVAIIIIILQCVIKNILLICFGVTI